MSEATILVSSAEIKEGVSEKTGKPWKRLVLKDGNGTIYSTFEAGLFEPTQKLVGKQAEIEFEQDGKFHNLTRIHAAVEEPKLGTGEYVKGQRPAIEARRQFASTAWNCAAAMARSELGFDTAQHIADRIFEDLLRKGKAMEDEDIPF